MQVNAAKRTRSRTLVDILTHSETISLNLITNITPPSIFMVDSVLGYIYRERESGKKLDNNASSRNGVFLYIQGWGRNTTSAC